MSLRPKLKGPEAGMMLSRKEHQRWNRALSLILAETTKKVIHLTTKQIQTLYPDGYPTSLLRRANWTAEGYVPTRRRPRKKPVLTTY